ncbi:MAG TPA: hypothetical protein VFH95_14550, partial [Candidatus Kapabacteria bacterium]|nr:hypothetical protein [Candidatus Kapabacteria bacterium]
RFCIALKFPESSPRDFRYVTLVIPSLKSFANIEYEAFRWEIAECAAALTQLLRTEFDGHPFSYFFKTHP